MFSCWNKLSASYVLHFFVAISICITFFFVPLFRSSINMSMKKSKLVSVRIDEDLLAKIDAIVEREKYISRSTLIEAGVMMIAQGYERQDVQKPWQFYPKWDEITEFVFKYRRKVTWPFGLPSSIGSKAGADFFWPFQVDFWLVGR